MASVARCRFRELMKGSLVVFAWYGVPVILIFAALPLLPIGSLVVTSDGEISSLRGRVREQFFPSRFWSEQLEKANEKIVDINEDRRLLSAIYQHGAQQDRREVVDLCQLLTPAQCKAEQLHLAADNIETVESMAWLEDDRRQRAAELQQIISVIRSHQ